MPDTRDPQSVIAAAEQAALGGDYATAERLLREAAGLQEASLGPLHPELANTLNNLGVVCEVTEKPDEAERCFRRASGIAAAVLPPDHPFVATSRKNLEDFCAARGIPVDVPIPANAPEPQAIERTAIERKPAAVTPAPIVPPPARLQKRNDEPPPVDRRPSRALVVSGVVAAALIVLVLAGRLWFRPGEAPPPAVVEPAASAPIARPAEPSEPSPASTPTTPVRAADAAAAKAAPAVVSVQLCANLGTSGPGDWRCDPPRNPVTPGRLYFYTRLTSQRETKVQHRWYLGERLRQSVELTVHANTGTGYRTYSRNTVHSGEWRVELRTRDGALLQEERFTVR